MATNIFMMCLSLFGIVTGIGLIYLRNWARISILIWGGMLVFFGGIDIPIAFLMPIPPTPSAPDLPAAGIQAVRLILLAIYGMPLLIGIWWLILFNRKTVKAVCGRDRCRRSNCASEACLPSPYRRARLVLCLFDFEPALPSLSSIPCASAGLRAGSSRKSGLDSFDTQLPCPFRLWRRALKTQAMELLSDDRSPGLLGCEYRREHAEPELQRRGGLFPEGNAGLAPSA